MSTFTIGLLLGIVSYSQGDYSLCRVFVFKGRGHDHGSSSSSGK